MSSTVVSTLNGKVKGQLHDLKREDAKPVYTYRNIPFAKPPVGNMRFMPPQPADPWDGVKDGTSYGNKPMYSIELQQSIEKFFPFAVEGEQIYDEDCLHLSIYTPSIEKGKNLPVMVWFYGGGFAMGSEREYNGSVLSAMNDVVVVVPNYRVGIFGFLSLGPNSICPGNQGIMDQQLALRWVQNNIDLFGGDKDNVTIFGESAGAISVGMHIMSPLSRGLFHKGISHSGTAPSPGVMSDEKRNEKCVNRFLEHSKIEGKDKKEILDSLQKMSANELVKASGSLELILDRVSFQPVYGGEVFPISPKESLKKKDYAKVPYIIGCNSTEGQGVMSIGAGPGFATGISEEVARRAMFIPMADAGFEKAKNFYMDPGDQSDTRYSKLVGDVIGDAVFVAPSIEVANAHSEAAESNIYVYYAKFKLKMFHEKEYMGELMKKVDWCICDHGDDIHLTFGAPFGVPLKFGAKYSKDEVQLSREFMRYITNFARTGDPNKGKKVGVAWPKYDPQKKTYLAVDTPFSTGSNLSPKGVDFWLNDMVEHIEL